MKEPGFESVAIVGLGLMGGSVALALKRWGESVALTGIDNDATARAEAIKGGITASGDLHDIASADLIVLATPVRSIVEQLSVVGEYAKTGALILDLGSTKREIVAAMDSLPTRLNPVGGHPMCGKESASFRAADAELFKGAPFVLTPLPRTTPATLDKAQAFVRTLGAWPIDMNPERHDRIVAAVSHLPFAVAAALMILTTKMAQSDEMTFQLAAGGFRDSTRLAASDTRMMLDTLLTNHDNVSQLLRAFARELDMVADAIASGDESGLRAVLEGAARRRREMFR